MHRQKICPQCKGRVPSESSECLYCTADLSDEKEREETLANYQSFEASLSTLYTPQYAAPSAPSHSDTAAISSLYPGYELPSEPETKTPFAAPHRAEAIPEEHPQGNRSFFSILLLSLGANFLCIGLMLLLLGKGGTLSLSWNTHYWPLYCLLGLPLTFLGWRVLRRID